MAPDKRQLCPNCQDGCERERECEGCDTVLCGKCWAEHNEDAPDHESENAEVVVYDTQCPFCGAKTYLSVPSTRSFDFALNEDGTVGKDQGDTGPELYWPDAEVYCENEDCGGYKPADEDWLVMTNTGLRP